MARYVGIDFDNTVVCYDEVFGQLARERGLAGDEPTTKGSLRDALRRRGQEDVWTRLQGEAYGPALKRAKAFPGAAEFIARCRSLGVGIGIISHKTRHPFLGPPYDLHQAARDWLEASGLGLPAQDVYFELTKEAKLRRIAEAGCTHFIDDLPEFLSEPSFPQGVERILFDPSGGPGEGPFRRAGSWGEIERWILG